jgi:WD40 repeat protein
MRWPRFTILQLFLVTALVGLLAGWWTQSWRSRIDAQLATTKISPDGRFLVAIYWSQSPQLWDISGGEPRRVGTIPLTNEFVSYNSWFLNPRFLENGSLVYFRYTQRGSELVEYAPDSGKERTLVRAPAVFRTWSVSLDGKTAVTFDGTATPTGAMLDVWDLASGQRAKNYHVAGARNLYQLEIDGRGTIVAASDHGGMQVEVLNVTTGKRRTIPGGRFGEPWALAADGKSLVVADSMRPGGQIADQGKIFVYDIGSPTETPLQFDAHSFASETEISSDGSRILLSSFAGAEVWDARAATPLWRRNEFSPSAAVFGPFPTMGNWKLSADGSRVAYTAKNREIHILDAATGQRLMTIGGTHRLRDTILYCTAFLVWAVAWGLVSRREKLRQPAATPTPIMPTFGFRLTSQRQGLIIMLVLIVILCGLLAWLLNGLIGGLLNMRPGIGPFLTIFAIIFLGLLGYLYLKMRLWPLWASLRIAQNVVGNTGRQQRHGKIRGLFAGESTIEHTYLNHIAEIRQKLADILGRDIQIKNELLIIGLERTDDFYLLNRTRLSHGGIVMTHLFAEECRVCEELAHRDGTTATVMLRATIALALLRRHWRIDAPVWLSAAISAYLAADEHRPATLKRAHRMLVGILGDEAPTIANQFVSMSLADRYTQIFQKDDPAILRELTLSQAIAVSLGEFLLGDRDGSPRDNMLEVIRSVGKRGKIDEAIERVFGSDAAGLIGPWWEWVQQQTLTPWELPPEEARWAIAELTRSVGPGSSLPVVEQQRTVTVLGAVCDLAAVPTLLTILESPEHSLRAEALWALRGISGERWDDDPLRWRAWWQEVEPHAAAASTSDRPSMTAQWTGGPWSDEIVKAELATAIREAENPGSDQPHEPWQVQTARTLMGAGGVWGIVLSVVLSFYSSTLVMMPTLGIALLIGLLATARAAGRHWWGLRTAAGLQIAAIVGCDPIQSLLGMAAAAALRGNDVRRYLQRIGGS